MTTLSIHTPIGFIGAGAVGGTLAVALAQAGYRVTAIASGATASAQGLAARVAGCGLCHGPTGGRPVTWCLSARPMMPLARWPRP